MNKKNLFSTISGGVFLICIGFIFLFKSLTFWPWILPVIALTSLVKMIGSKKIFEGVNLLIWFTGLAFLFYFNIFWPGILFILGLSVIFSAIIKYNK